MNANLWLLAAAQSLFLINNAVFIAINGLVGLSIAPVGWMATLPVMGYVVGGALSTSVVSRTQARWGRKRSFQSGLLVALGSALLCAWAVMTHQFALLVAGTVIAGYYNANAQLYRFAAAELAAPGFKEKAVSLVLAGGIAGGVLGPTMASVTRTWTETPFVGAYLTLAIVAVIAMLVIQRIEFPPVVPLAAGASSGRPLRAIMAQPVFIIAAGSAALSYGVMNLLMAATPLAMQTCGMPFGDTALVLEWHIIGMFAPGFFTGHLIKRFGALAVMGVGVLLNLVCVAVALSGTDLSQFLVALFTLGVGWNFVFTGSTTLSLQAYAPEEKDRAQGAINFFVFATMAVTSFASGALVTTQGWALLNMGSILPIIAMGAGIWWLSRHPQSQPGPRSV
jgi:MFS family permease